MHYRKYDDSLKEFTRRALPENWLDYAYELRDASNLIWNNASDVGAMYTDDNTYYPKPYYSRSSILLYALAIENLIKGILISENPKLIEGGKISSTISSGHDLIRITKKIKSIEFSKDDQNVLAILSEAIPDWGKYPIPKHHNNVKDEENYTDNQRNRLKKLFNKLENSLLELNKDGSQEVNGVTFPKIVRFTNEDEFLKFIENK